MTGGPIGTAVPAGPTCDVLPYFKRAEDNQRLVNEYHGTGGPLGVSAPINPLPISEAFIRAAQEYGIPYNADFNGATRPGSVITRSRSNAKRSSAASAYIKPVRNRPNLTVRTGVSVTKIVVERGRAIGVEIVEGGKPSVIHAEREVCLTAGAINSPRLLMLSGIGPADHLRSVGVPVVHDLPGVGGNLQDHLDLYAIAECSGDYTYDNVAKPYRTVLAGLQYILTKKGPAASTLFETGGFWFADKNETAPDIQFHLGLGSGIEAGVDSPEERRHHVELRLSAAPLTRNGAFGVERPDRTSADRPELLGRSP